MSYEESFPAVITYAEVIAGLFLALKSVTGTDYGFFRAGPLDCDGLCDGLRY